MIYTRRRALIRVFSYLFAALAIAIAFSAQQYNRAQTYKRFIEYSYQRALFKLADDVKAIDSALQKQVYAMTPMMMATLSADIYRRSDEAKNDIAEIPVSIAPMSKTMEFLSQTGGFCSTLASKIISGQNIDEKDRETLRKLSDYAGKLAQQLTQAVADLSAGALTFEDISNAARQSESDFGDTQKMSVSSNLVNAESEFEQYASLIYDGPFSAHIMQKKPQLLEGKPMLTADKAAESAAKFLRIPKEQLKFSSASQGNIPTYSFEYGQTYIEVTKQGGIVMNMVNNKLVKEPRLDTKTAIKKASDFLKQNGFENMEENYYETRDNTLVVNFAYVQNGVTCYTDLVKVGVALDDGSIVFFEARSYITSHRERSFSPKLSKDEAKQKLASDLTIENARLALIPSRSDKEALCWEFKGKGYGDRTYLIYINAETGGEEQILILLIDENGTLAI